VYPTCGGSRQWGFAWNTPPPSAILPHMNTLFRYFARTPPWPVLLVVLMTIGAAVFQFPFYRMPWGYSPLYFLVVGLLAGGIYAGARWAFVVDVITVWIFPFETLVGVKPPIRGSVLSVLHIIAVVLRVISWR
jgi:hypothetical protein